jgi:hypothetical protein
MVFLLRYEKDVKIAGCASEVTFVYDFFILLLA